MANLFEAAASAAAEQTGPLAHRARPRALEEFVGQQHLLARGKVLGELIRRGQAFSALFAGPPGTGKTTLARIVSAAAAAEFIRINAVMSSVGELREHLREAGLRLGRNGTKTILFIDELHRFNRSQQDALLPDLEEGKVYLLATTTENPNIAINTPILSRMRVFHFKPLAEEELVAVMRRGIEALGDPAFAPDDESLLALSREAQGDARQAHALLETCHRVFGCLDADAIRELRGGSHLTYDRAGDEHFNVASAFIKSMRGSDPDATLHYLARMIEGGEDARFIARRIVIAASEEIGNADPLALVVAESAARAAEFVGFPESKLILAQAALYVACAVKSNAVTTAIGAALDDLKANARAREVPLHLRNQVPRGMKGKPYRYPHDSPGSFVREEYFPDPVRFYFPKDAGTEKKIRDRLAAWWGKEWLEGKE
ncbi:MAG: replication-associated recombination protein A [Candidatus Wallbacteria bacterium]|nr:replication-associated recombination protein A [Candidatus Wallbacteria bacterium]